MTEPIFFEIPIYRITKLNFSQEMDSTLEKHYRNYPGDRIGEHFQNYKNVINRNHKYPWKYNEIIGYLNLYIYGSQLRIDYWLVSNQRINKGIRKKKFYYNFKAFEATISKNMISIEIFEWILNQLKILQNDRRFKKRYFDIAAFEVVGKYIDWKTLFDELNSLKNPEIKKEYLKNK